MTIQIKIINFKSQRPLLNTTVINMCIICGLLGLFSSISIASKQNSRALICLNAVTSENFKLAEKLCEKQFSLAEQSMDHHSELAILIALIDVHKHLGNSIKFNEYVLRAESHLLFNTSPNLKYKWLRLQGINHHHLTNYNQSNKFFTDALAIAIELKDDEKISHSNIDLGISSKALGDYKKALSHYRTSLDITRELNDFYAMGLSLKNVGNVYVKLEEYQSAIQYFNEALNSYENYLTKPHYDPRVHNRINAVYQSLVEVYQNNNQPLKAQPLKQKIKLNESSISSNHDFATHMVQEAKALIHDEAFSEAANKLVMALRLYQSQGIQKPTFLYNLLAETYQRLNQIDLAIHYAESGLKDQNISQTNLNDNNVSLQLLSRLYQKSNPKLALDYAQKYIANREEFLSQKYNSDLQTIQHQIELEKSHNQLMTSKLENIKHKVKLQSLNNKFLLSLLLLIILLMIVIYLNFIKKRDRRDLEASVNFHKNQMAVLSLSSKPQNQEADNSALKIEQSKINECLVAIMHDATNLWLEQTGENLIELADKSKIWTITNDSGTLRARSLEKYLSINKIPNNPRWRNVVRTCHFILAETNLSAIQRQSFNQQLESLMLLIKSFYGTSK